MKSDAETHGVDFDGVTLLTSLRRRPESLRIDDARVTLGNQTLVERRTLRGAFATRTPQGTFVHLERGAFRRDVVLRARTLGQGREIVSALGFDPAQSTSVFRVRAGSVREMRARLALFVLSIVVSIALGLTVLRFARPSFGPVDFCMICAAIGVYAMGLLQMARSTRVAIGADGVRIESRGGERFIPVGQIAGVSVVGPAGVAPSSRRSLFVRIALRGADPVELVVAYRARGTVTIGLDGARVRAEAIAEKIFDARRAAGDGGESSATRALDRGGASVEAWMTKLRDPSTRRATFREGVELADDELWRIVEDPQVEPEHRAAAAVALGRELPEEGKSKLRLVAQAAAAPRLRVALEAAADGDDDELAAALGDMKRVDADEES